MVLTGEDSLSHHVDYQVGLSIIDRFTYYLLEFLQGIGAGSKATMQDLIEHIRYRHAYCLSVCSLKLNALADLSCLNLTTSSVAGPSPCIQHLTTRQPC